MGHITQIEAQLVALLRKEGVLQEMTPHRVDLSAGAIVLMCSDGDQKEDQDGFLCQILRDANGGQVREHIIALNGGALLLSEAWQTTEEGVVLLRHFRQARELKGINTILLHNHWPCGAGGMVGMNLLQAIAYFVSAKAKVKAEFKGEVAIVPLFHVDYDGTRKRTYFVSLEQWANFVARHLCRLEWLTSTFEIAIEEGSSCELVQA